MAMPRILVQGLMIGSLGAFLLGCTVGPDYEKPQTSLPENWKSADNTMPNAANDAQAAIEQAWWRNFNDPVLSRLIEKSLAGNYDLKIAEARIAEARASRAAADATLWPQGDFKGAVTREANQLPVPVTLPGIAKPFDIYQTGFDASWELDLFGGNKRAEEAATYSLQASEASFSDVRVSLLAEVARTYVDIRQYQAQLKIAGDTVAADQNTLSIAKQRADAGTAPGLDVTQAEAQLEQARAGISTYRSQLAQAEYSMDLLLGAPPGAAQSIIGDARPIPAANQQLVLAAPAAVIDNRPDIHMAERKLAAATAQQGVATAQFYPDISLSGFFGLLTTNGGNLFTSASKSWLMGSSVMWPILSYGKLEANLESADASQKEALATYQKTVIAALSDVEKSVTAYTQQEQFETSFAKSVGKNRHASVIAKQRYKEGMTSFLEALDADRTLYASELQLAQADGDAARDLISVYKSLGGGWKPEAAVAAVK
jgi:NodT family efflux transporter outer membrane factor (OMF) lipoprotein